LETEQLLTDSLTALGMLKSWARWPAARVLSCADRVDVRRALHIAGRQATFPVVEKVKAHKQKAIDVGDPRRRGTMRRTGAPSGRRRKTAFRSGAWKTHRSGTRWRWWTRLGRR